MAQVVRTLALAWLVSLPLLTAARASVWQSDVTVWADAAEGSSKPRPWLNLGSALIAAQWFPEARMALAHAFANLDGRSDEERRVGLAYGLLLWAQLDAVDGQWNDARARAASLRARVPDWAPAQQFCAEMGC